MSDKPLYLLDPLSLGASDLVYASRADGSADGYVSFTGMAATLGGVLDGFFAPTGHTHSIGQITGAGDLASLNTVNNAQWSGTPLAVGNGGTGSTTPANARTALGLAIGTNVQASSANLTTYAGIAPSSNVQTLLGAADFAAFRTSLSIGSIGLLSTITEANQTLANNTTNNVSTSKHGYAPILPNDATKYLDGTGAYSVPAGSGGSSTIVQPQGRLTLTSNTPVMIADATAQTSVYYAPYVGKYYPVYSGSTWSMLGFTQLTMALDTTNQLLENLYDLFVWNNSATPAIGAGPAWTNTATITVTIATPAVVSWTGHGLPEGAPVRFTTSGALPTGITAGTTYYVTNTPSTNTFNISTSVANAAAGTKVATSGSQSGTHTGTNHTTIRGTGAGTTELEFKDGIWTNKNSITLTNSSGAGTSGIAANTATYVGTIYCTANGQTGMAFTPAATTSGNANILGLYNAYNRVPVRAMSRDSTTSWTYTSTTWRAANASVSNRISWVDGLQQSTVTGAYNVSVSTSTTLAYWTGMTLDNTVTAPQNSQQGVAPGGTAQIPMYVLDIWKPQSGFHYIQTMESVQGSTVTFSGARTSPTGQLNALMIDLMM